MAWFKIVVSTENKSVIILTGDTNLPEPASSIDALL